MESKGDYKLQLFDEEATQFAFFATTDTTKRDPNIYKKDKQWKNYLNF